MRKIIIRCCCDGHPSEEVDFEVENTIHPEDLEKECEEQFNDWLGSTISTGYGIVSNEIIKGVES